ncbi:hypothetical protein F4805DRAFT_450956, partial [Annulohypoxylon moriforme]
MQERLLKETLLRFIPEREIPSFLQLLRSTRSIIAGGIPTQLLIDETWPSSDLDIWIPMSIEAFNIIAEPSSPNDISSKLHQVREFESFVNLFEKIGYSRTSRSHTANRDNFDELAMLIGYNMFDRSAGGFGYEILESRSFDYTSLVREGITRSYSSLKVHTPDSILKRHPTGKLGGLKWILRGGFILETYHDPNRHQVQLLLVPSTCAVKYMIAQFHSTTVMNFFDGNNLVSLFPTHLHNRWLVPLKPITSNNGKKYAKYMSRGFEIKEVIEVEPENVRELFDDGCEIISLDYIDKSFHIVQLKDKPVLQEQVKFYLSRNGMVVEGFWEASWSLPTRADIMPYYSSD